MNLTKTMNGSLLVDRFSAPQQLIAVMVGVVLLTASSHAEVPMYPIPVTMQTGVVLLIGALYGFSLGLATVMAWLGLAMMGLPLLVGGAGGLLHFTGPTAGYLLGFLFSVGIVGWLSDRGWNGKSPLLALVAMFVGGTIILATGWVWLASIIGAEKAWLAGVQPFLLGDLLKVLLSVMVLVGVHKLYTEKFLRQ